MNLKERAEQTVIGELRDDRTLVRLLPQPQASNKPVKLPLIAVVVSPGAEFAQDSGIFRIPVSIVLTYDAKAMPAASGDAIMEKIRARMTIAQSRTSGPGYGVIFGGETERVGDSDTKRVRTLSLTLIGK